jgi:hypothetical protein
VPRHLYKVSPKGDPHDPVALEPASGRWLLNPLLEAQYGFSQKVGVERDD